MSGVCRMPDCNGPILDDSSRPVCKPDWDLLPLWIKSQWNRAYATGNAGDYLDAEYGVLEAIRNMR